MTDTLLALVPNYGIWLIFICVFLSCLALPVPSSILVMTAGGFVAAGDISLVPLLVVSIMGFALGDQVMYWSARKLGSRMPKFMRGEGKAATIFERAGQLLERFGAGAIVISHTVLSPLGPYVSFLAGSTQSRPVIFTFASVIGAAIWASGYVSIGYIFAGQIAEVAELISAWIGIAVLLLVVVILFAFLWRAYLRARKAEANISEDGLVN